MNAAYDYSERMEEDRAVRQNETYAILTLHKRQLIIQINSIRRHFIIRCPVQIY